MGNPTGHHRVSHQDISVRMNQVHCTRNTAQYGTTGPGKQVKVLEIFVAQDAYVSQTDWLAQGLALWNGLGENRENFILLPSSDLSGFRNTGAEAQDKVALTRHSLGLAIRESHQEAATPAERCAGRF